MEPTRKEILREAKRLGIKVTKARATLNGCTAYRVEGYPNAIFSKYGLMDLLGLWGSR